MDYLDQLDRQLMLWLNYDGGALQDQLWWMVSGKFTWIPLYLWLLWLLVLYCRPVKVNWKKLTLLVVITALVVVISDQVASGIIKNVVMRPRPSRPDSGIAEWIHIVHGYRGGHYGFVSSHASNTWGVALWFIFLIKNWLRTEANTLSPMLRRALRISLWALLSASETPCKGIEPIAQGNALNSKDKREISSLVAIERIGNALKGQ